MQTRTPVRGVPQTLVLGRGWVLPALLLGFILAGSYLPAHGVTQLLDVLAATIAALGLVAVSLAAPRWVRAVVLARGGRLALIGSLPLWQAEPEASVRRRIAAVAVGALVSAAGFGVAAVLLPTGDSLTAGHAVLLVALYANLALLLSNIVPVPPWPGWTLLLALLDGRRAVSERRVDRAVLFARGMIAAEAAAVAVLAIGSGDWMLLLVAALLIWQGWMQTAATAADDLIGRYLATRRLGDVARDFSTIAGPDDLAVAAVARRKTDREVMAVQGGDTVLGAIGPRQAAAISPSARGARCADAMVALGDLELLRSEAPAVSALAQLDRFGFALVVGAGQLRYVEVNDLLQRILLTAAVAQAVSVGNRRKRNSIGMERAKPARTKSTVPPAPARKAPPASGPT